MFLSETTGPSKSSTALELLCWTWKSVCNYKMRWPKKAGGFLPPAFAIIRLINSIR